VRLPTLENSRALVYLGMSGLVANKIAVGAGSFGMDDPLGDTLTIEMGHLSKSKKSSKTIGPRGPTVSEF